MTPELRRFREHVTTVAYLSSMARLCERVLAIGELSRAERASPNRIPYCTHETKGPECSTCLSEAEAKLAAEDG